MRVVITADLHYRPSQREEFVRFARQIAAQEPDCLILAGDIGHPLRLFYRALQLFADLPCPKLLIIGNHDLYRGEFDSRTLWERELPRAAQEEGFVWLENRAVTLPLVPGQVLPLPTRQPATAAYASSQGPAGADVGGLAGTAQPDSQSGGQLGICGSMAWYDYSWPMATANIEP